MHHLAAGAHLSAAAGMRYKVRMRKSVFIFGVIGMATAANAQAPSPDGSVAGWPPVPPLADQTGIENYCVHGNLLYSKGDVLCVGAQGLVCVPSSGGNGGTRPYWSSVPVGRGDVNWSPPARCGRE
jgi:hypothetical protein